MNIKEVIGIDISKQTFDCCIHTLNEHRSFENSTGGIAQMVEWVLCTTGRDSSSLREVLFVLEHTGLYGHVMVEEFGRLGLVSSVVPALAIRRSLGITRGKSDKLDARRIARYGYLFREDIDPTSVYSKVIQQLQSLTSMRRKLVAQRAGHKATLGEQKRVLDRDRYALLLEVQAEIIRTFDQQIKRIEREIERVIEQDPQLRGIYTLLVSIKGIGPVTARFLIIHTKGFTAFSTWRKFASYCGIAPFPYTSGTSVRGRTKVSNLANKEGKALLSQCAASAVQYSSEMKKYYQQRVKQGKNGMSTLNIIRNKLLARAFAVVQRRSPYVDTMKYAA